MRIAAVSYLNTAPLIEGLDAWAGCEMVRAVPAGIGEMVARGEVDFGLVSVVDFAQYAAVEDPLRPSVTSPASAGDEKACGGDAGCGLVMVPAGMIGCEGATLTVRLFSSVPIEEISVVHADTDSHTSVVLCDLVLRALYGIEAGFVGFDAREGVVVGGEEKTGNGQLAVGNWEEEEKTPSALRAPPPQARGRSEDDDCSGCTCSVADVDCAGDHSGGPETVLMIGDKVVTGAGVDEWYPYQIDLGEAWLRMTGLPFVYAVWMCRADRVGDADVRAGAVVLERTMLRNRMRMDWIVGRHAARTGWPVELAERYLGELLRFEVDDRAREAVGKFLSMAADAGLVERVEPVWMELAGDEEGQWAMGNGQWGRENEVGAGGVVGGDA